MISRHRRSARTPSADTTPSIARRQIELWRAMSTGGRLSAAGGAALAVEQLSLAGIRGRAPDDTGERWFLALATLKLGSALTERAYRRGAAPGSRSRAPMNPLHVARIVAQALESCGVRYVLGGSLASSVSGEPRATLDIDLMVDLSASAVPCVLAALGDDFYAEPDAFVRAIRDRACVNAIHLPTATKVDFFIMGATSIEAHQMERRQIVRLNDPPGAELYVYTPEDILLQKLRWCRMGGKASDRQWRDVMGIVSVQDERLDRDYLRAAAAEIGVSELLERALEQ